MGRNEPVLAFEVHSVLKHLRGCSRPHFVDKELRTFTDKKKRKSPVTYWREVSQALGGARIKPLIFSLPVSPGLITWEVPDKSGHTGLGINCDVSYIL